jgi:hypothetical protein
MSDVRGRLKRLERQAGARDGRCPHCPPLAVVFLDGAGGVASGSYPRLACASCGGPYDGRPSALVFGRCGRPDENCEGRTHGQA